MKKKKNSGKRIALIVLCTVLALILVLMIAGMIFLQSLMNLIGRVDDNGGTVSPDDIHDFLNDETIDPDFSGAVVDPEDVIWGSGVKPVINHDNVINILLIGQDRREGEERQRSDAIILCTINKSTKTLTMTSFMRDLYVPIPGYRDNRINACYQLGGMELLDDCLYENFGVVVDGNVEVDFFGFMNAIDLMGGVDIELNSTEASYLNRRGNWDVDNSTAGQWNLQEGMNHLTGEQALAFSRIRYVGNGDFERTDRQRRVLSALLEKCKELNYTQIYKLLREVLPLMTTDLTNGEILGYALEVIPTLSDLEVNTQRIPAEGMYYNASIRGMAVLVPDLDENSQLLGDCMKEVE